MLGDIVGGVEAGGLGLFEGERAGGGVAEEERGRGEEAGDAEEEVVAGVAGGDDADADVGRDGELLVAPAGERGGVDVGAALHVFERGDEQAGLGGGGALEELIGAGREDDGGFEVRGILEDVGEFDVEQRSLLEGLELAGGGPVLVDAEQDAAVDEAGDIGLGGDAELLGAVGREDPGLALEDGDGAGEEGEGVLLVVVEGVAAGAEVGGLAAEDFFGAVERRAALPELDDEGIAGGGHGAGAPVARDDQGVLVEPGDALLAVREGEAAGDELAGFEIELALGVGVFAAGGERDHAEAVAGIEAVEALGDPLDVVLLAECVVVDDGLPGGVGGEVVGERGLAVDAVDVARRRARGCRSRSRAGRAREGGRGRRRS